MPAVSSSVQTHQLAGDEVASALDEVVALPCGCGRILLVGMQDMLCLAASWVNNNHCSDKECCVYKQTLFLLLDVIRYHTDVDRFC